MRSAMWLGYKPLELDIFHEVSEACMYSTCIYMHIYTGNFMG